jgi:hypothetical protein
VAERVLADAAGFVQHEGLWVAQRIVEGADFGWRSAFSAAVSAQ